MSRKRVASDALTGGTKDVNPQYLSGLITLSAANTATEVTLGTPIVRVGPQTGGKSIIMEILKLYVDFPAIDADAAAATARAMTFSVQTVASTAVTTLDNPRNIAFLSLDNRNAFTAAGTGTLSERVDPSVWDFTDGAGHGVLVATDNIFLAANTQGQAGASVFRFKILYRFKEVSLVEYIGIVQSQQ